MKTPRIEGYGEWDIEVDGVKYAGKRSLTEAYQAGIDEAVEVVKKMQIQKPEHKGSEFSTPRDYHWRGYYTALDDTIKALQSKK